MLDQPLTLPCGAVVPNRLCKAAMTEGLAHPDGTASEELERLYGIWSDVNEVPHACDTKWVTVRPPHNVAKLT